MFCIIVGLPLFVEIDYTVAEVEFFAFFLVKCNKKLTCRRVTARCVLSVVILQITTQQCRIRQVLTKQMV